MSFEEKGIRVKQFGDTWAAVIRLNVQTRAEIIEKLEILSISVPPEIITGPPFWIRHFINSYAEGFDAEIGLPVCDRFESGEIAARYLPAMEVLAKTLTGTIDQLGAVYQVLFGCQGEYGLISDEYCVEVLHGGDPQDGPIEVMFVRHPWERLFREAATNVLGEETAEKVMGDPGPFFLEASKLGRFEWAKTLVDRLDKVSDEGQRYEILSGCSHIFPGEQAEKMRAVFRGEIEKGAGLLEAVDAVVAFMEADPGWRPNIYREGNLLFTTKNPSNPEAYASATTDLERKQAYCFCPILSHQMENAMSDSFCYCSAGWERKQWEVALGQPLRIEVVKSLLKGDMECQFAVYLPEEQG
ncbi:MAG: hypothetical protein JW757_05035 [Anaerolineales bacterium]|nr:hypothetical protein [Anaerolineales bacterium]